MMQELFRLLKEEGGRKESREEGTVLRFFSLWRQVIIKNERGVEA